MSNAKSFLTEKGIPEALVAGLEDGAASKMAKAMGFIPDYVAVTTYTPTKGKTANKPAQYLTVEIPGSYNSVFVRLCDGEALTDEGKEKAKTILTQLANNAADLLETL